MTYENKLLLSLANISEREKLSSLKANLSLHEILNLIRSSNTKNLDQNLLLFDNYNCVFVDELNYPLNLCKVEVPPFRLASTKTFPSPFDYYIGVLGSNIAKLSLLEEYYKFGNSLSKTKIGLITLNFGGISQVIERGYLDNNKTPFSLLASGFSFLNSFYYKKKRVIHISPFEINTKPSRNSFANCYEIFGCLIDALVIFECNEKDDCKRAISSVLDCGTNIFVHKSAVKDDKTCSISYELATQGCSIIDTINDLV